MTYAVNYDPFGVPVTGIYGGSEVQQYGSGQSSLGFTGEQTDQTGLQYLRARYYDPASGTFLSQDPMIGAGSSQSYNGYSYANNNPINLTDPSGKCIEDLCIGEAMIALSIAQKILEWLPVIGAVGGAAGEIIHEGQMGYHLSPEAINLAAADGFFTGEFFGGIGKAGIAGIKGLPLTLYGVGAEELGTDLYIRMYMPDVAAAREVTRAYIPFEKLGVRGYGLVEGEYFYKEFFRVSDEPIMAEMLADEYGKLSPDAKIQRLKYRFLLENGCAGMCLIKVMSNESKDAAAIYSELEKIKVPLTQERVKEILQNPEKFGLSGDMQAVSSLREYSADNMNAKELWSLMQNMPEDARLLLAVRYETPSGEIMVNNVPHASHMVVGYHATSFNAEPGVHIYDPNQGSIVIRFSELAEHFRSVIVLNP